MRCSVPTSTAHDTLTHITGKNGASGATYGNRTDAGVTHSGRKGLANSGSVYNKPCYARAWRGGRGEGIKGRGCGCGGVGGRMVRKVDVGISTKLSGAEFNSISKKFLRP
jgi:hypothetical protein